MNATASVIPAVGTSLEGGFFAGVVNINGEHFGIVVAPKEAGESAPKPWNKSAKAVAGAGSFFDGLANTEVMVAAGSALAKWARGLEIGGFADWYLPARDELELAYRAFKPTTEVNWCWRGDNPSSIPVGYAYQPNLPAQTTVAAFQSGGEHAFEVDWYWSSTQSAGDEQCAWCQNFSYGGQYDFLKSIKLRARAVRRFRI